MAFDYFRFDDLLSQIEEKLGYLKGNELGYQYLLDAREQAGGAYPPNDNYTFADAWLEDCTFPVPGHPVDMAHAFMIRFWIPREVYEDADDVTAVANEMAEARKKFMTEVAEGAVQAWRNGASWASGIASYCREICDAFTRPDAQRMAQTVAELHNQVTAKLALNVEDDWAGLGGIEGDWDSRAGRNFQTFYANYDGHVANLAYFSVLVAQTFAAAAQVIHGTQEGVIKFAESVVKILDQQLEAWAPHGPRPEDPPEEPPWVADVTAIVKEGWDVLGHVPVVKDVKSQVDAVLSAGRDVTEFAQAIANASGVDLDRVERTLSGAGADDIYELLTRTLYEDYQQKYVAAMDSLQTGTSVDPGDDTYEAPINTGATRGQLPKDGFFPESQIPAPESII